jgi:hypothetical protein
MVKLGWLMSVVLTTVALTMSGSAAAPVKNGDFRVLTFQKTQDAFYNYDFDSKNAAIYRDSLDVDWGMSLLFRNGASKGRVNDKLNDVGNRGRGFWLGGSPKYGLVDDGRGFGDPDANSGRKGGCPGPGFTTDHYRVYSDNGGDFMSARYRPDLGHYVIGSIHQDHSECPPGTPGAWAGESEDAEIQLARDLIKEWGRRNVNYKWAYWHNREKEWDDDHHWNHDGWASNFKLPNEGPPGPRGPR